MSRDLKNYDTVKSRKKKFYEKYPDGRIIIEQLLITEEQAVMKATVYKSIEDQRSHLPWATGFAQEFKGVGGVANKFAWLENCEESAVGRALDNAGFSTILAASESEMRKVARMEAEEKTSVPQAAQKVMTVIKQDSKPTFDIPDNAGKYRIKFGKKYKDIALEDIEVYATQSFIEWCKKEAEKAGKPMSFEAQELSEAFKRYLDQMADKKSGMQESNW